MQKLYNSQETSTDGAPLVVQIFWVNCLILMTHFVMQVWQIVRGLSLIMEGGVAGFFFDWTSTTIYKLKIIVVLSIIIQYQYIMCQCCYRNVYLNFTGTFARELRRYLALRKRWWWIVKNMTTTIKIAWVELRWIKARSSHVSLLPVLRLVT